MDVEKPITTRVQIKATAMTMTNGLAPNEVFMSCSPTIYFCHKNAGLARAVSIPA